MKYANLNGRLVAASITAPATAKCAFCGRMVELRTAPGMTGPLWLHVTETEAASCAREREAEQVNSISERKDK